MLHHVLLYLTYLTYMLWPNLKDFLPKPMCLKYKEKGHSKMHPSVPDYIYMYVVLETKSRNNNTKEISSKARRTAVTNAMKKRHAAPK